MLTMPRYFFHIRDGADLATDTEGAEFASLELAYEEAVHSAREILSQRLLHGGLINGQSFEITDERGSVLAVLKFKDVMKIA